MPQNSGHRKSRRRQLQASHQKNWLTGRYAVLEALRSVRWPTSNLYLADDLSAEDQEEAQRLADNANVSLQRCSRERLLELSGSDHHQGYIARMADYPYLSVESLLEQTMAADRSSDASQQPLLVMFDRIQDSFNFGAILRCCDAMNVGGVIIGQAQQVGVTPQVARSSSGAVNHVPIAATEDLLSTATALKSAGFSIAAASEKSTFAAFGCQLSKPIALVIGSEAHGVSQELMDVCDEHLRIPMLGQVSSLNAAVAAGILLYEIRRQQMQ